MTKKIFGGTEAKIVHYLETVFAPEDAVLKNVREDIERSDIPQIQVGKMDGQILEVLTRMTGAKKAVEIGTLGGYSGICIARGLAVGGKLYTFEIQADRAEFAKEAFKKAGLTERVNVITGSALDKLPEIEKEAPFDLVFIDADKASYPKYLKWAAEFLRVGGTVVADNTLGWGMIADDRFESTDDEKLVKGLQEFNRESVQTGRFKATMIPTGEGLTVAVKVK